MIETVHFEESLKMDGSEVKTLAKPRCGCGVYTELCLMHSGDSTVDLIRLDSMPVVQNEELPVCLFRRGIGSLQMRCVGTFAGTPLSAN